MIKCELCNKEYKTIRGLSSHINKLHKEITQQYYYDMFINNSLSKYVCPTCGKPTKFISIGYGYKKHCNQICANKDTEIIKIRHETLNNTFGHPFTRSEVLAKCKQTYINRYGVDNPYQIENNRIKAHSKEALEKHYNTLKKNGTFKTSKIEDKCYYILTQYFCTVLRNYKSDIYPFRCDFYIPNIDCYIECNFHWTHGGHWFDENNQDDINKVKNWSNRSKYFDNAINTWTIRDINKRNYAKSNKLNYIVLWTLDDFNKWVKSNFELKKDY